ncbi:hypothetical protein LSTR_LSTR004345 [Laodelphax striatellus]|uniref:C2H2-type domain-containing protein n=1 Tax=Laodelphax striatellus TaxID=195883 RepID=A0A482X901_LAOST|nr:hypothetical protein LSTR_LSTR004345 [Laodelphax striatellus]
MSSLSCPICHKHFTKRYSMKRHYTRIHPKVEVPEYLSPKVKDSMKCAICDSIQHNFNDLECHLLSHNIKLESEIVTFENKTQFYDWKKRLEDDEKVQYVQNTGRRVSTNNSITIYYVCHRSGSYKPMVSSLERKRQLKIQGSSKINAFCPSRIKATFQTKGNVVVEFCWTHLGHSNDLAHLNSCHDVKLECERSEDKKQLVSRPLGLSSSGSKKIDFKNILPSENDFRKIKFRHKMSLKLKADSIVKCKNVTEPAWIVRSEDEQQCRVKSLKTVCDCLLFCKYCKVCSHKYSCTCPDASVKGNLCKHMHLLCQVNNSDGRTIEHNTSNISLPNEIDPKCGSNQLDSEVDQLNCGAIQFDCGVDQFDCEATPLRIEPNDLNFEDQFIMNCGESLLNSEADQLNCNTNQLNCVTNPLNCNTDQLNCVTNQITCHTDQLNCITNPITCSTDQLNCITNQIPLNTDQLNCVTNQITCNPDQLNTVTNHITCNSDQLNCVTNQLNCHTNQITCNTDQLNSVTNQLTCGTDQLNCVTNQLNCDPSQLSCNTNQLSSVINQSDCASIPLDYEGNQLNCTTNQLNYNENQLNYNPSQFIFDDLNQNSCDIVPHELSKAKNEIFEEFRNLLESAKTQQDINLLRIGVRGLKTFIETIEITQDQGIQLPKIDQNTEKDDSVIQFMIM